MTAGLYAIVEHYYDDGVPLRCAGLHDTAQAAIADARTANLNAEAAGAPVIFRAYQLTEIPELPQHTDRK